MNNISASSKGKTLLFAEDEVRVIKQITVEEVNTMRRFGRVRWVERNGRTVGVCLTSEPQQSKEYDHEQSFGGGVIRPAEMDENAMPGTRAYGKNRYGGDDPKIVGNFTDHVLSKMELYPFVGDTKAPRVSPRP